MSIQNSNIDSFDAGRRHALAAIRASMNKGMWTPQERTGLRRRAVRLRQLHLRQNYQRAYYAGLISVLKSRLSAKFPRAVSPCQEYESGWDWESDENTVDK